MPWDAGAHNGRGLHYTLQSVGPRVARHSQWCDCTMQNTSGADGDQQGLDLRSTNRRASTTGDYERWAASLFRTMSYSEDGSGASGSGPPSTRPTSSLPPPGPAAPAAAASLQHAWRPPPDPSSPMVKLTELYPQPAQAAAPAQDEPGRAPVPAQALVRPRSRQRCT
jgi:hypothetical protein